MRRTNEKVRKYYESLGYMIYIKPHTRWDKDIFHLFDALAIKDKEVIFIQIKTNKFSGTKKIENFAKKYK